jgi:hypothetical protein
MFLGLRFFPPFFFLLGGLHYFSCKNFVFLVPLPVSLSVFMWDLYWDFCAIIVTGTYTSEIQI